MAKLNKSTSTSAKLKASGAKYSTTNSSGKQSFYSSSNEGSKAIGTSSRSSSSVIPMDAMQKTDVPNIPPKPQVNDVGTTPLSIDPALSQMGYSVQDNQYVYDPKKTEGENAVAQASNQNMSTLQSVLSFIGKPEDKSQEFARLEKKAGISDLQRQVGDYTSSLNNIVAKQQQDLLQLRGTGSEQGVTEAVYGGQQATINREAAIRALPVQAALSAAQGNLEMAQQRVNQLFSIKSADMDAQYKYKQDVGNAVLQIANEEQKNILNLKLSEIKDKNDLAKDNLNYLRDLTNTAIQNGRTGAIAQIAAIDPKSPTFNQDVARIAGGLSKPTGGAVKRDTAFDKDGNLVDMQTGEVIRSIGGGAMDTQKQEQINETLSLARELLQDGGIWDETGKSSAIGASLAKFVPFGQSLGLQGDRTAFANKVDTLKANLTLENLGLLKGPMSDKDLAFLQAIGSSLSTNMSEKEFNTQVGKIVTKLEEKAFPVSNNGTRVVTAPDGVQIEIID